MRVKTGGICAAVLALAPILLAGCGGVNLWPFGDGGRDISRAPANATKYQCDGGKRFYVRNLEDAAAVWLILPEREVRLNKVAAAAGARYATGKLTLEITGANEKSRGKLVGLDYIKAAPAK